MIWCAPNNLFCAHEIYFPEMSFKKLCITYAIQNKIVVHWENTEEKRQHSRLWVEERAIRLALYIFREFNDHDGLSHIFNIYPSNHTVRTWYIIFN